MPCKKWLPNSLTFSVWFSSFWFFANEFFSAMIYLCHIKSMNVWSNLVDNWTLDIGQFIKTQVFYRLVPNLSSAWFLLKRGAKIVSDMAFQMCWYPCKNCTDLIFNDPLLYQKPRSTWPVSIRYLCRSIAKNRTEFGLKMRSHFYLYSLLNIYFVLSIIILCFQLSFLSFITLE